MAKQKKIERSGSGGTIALNKRARHDYHLDERFEAGLMLMGWEVKSLREGKAQIGESYALVKDGELYLFGAQIQPLLSASTHVVPEARRTRKLLLHRGEIDHLIGAIERKGVTLVPTAMYWKKNKVKLELALARGKQDHDKRETLRRREVDRETRAAVKERVRK